MKGQFLKDVFICSLGAYGGPEAHYGVFMDQLVTKKKYLTEEEMVELIALCSMLPGPSSTQTIVAIGYKIGGKLLALLTFLVWALPVILAMTLFSFAYQLTFLSEHSLRYVGPIAIGFIVVAAYRISRKVITDGLTLTLMLGSAVVAFLVRASWIFPLLLILGGAITVFFSKEDKLWAHKTIRPPWHILMVFMGIGLVNLLASARFDVLLIQLFESFYRYGYLVFGGGQVVVPMMHTELVHLRGFLTNDQFLAGYGLVQGLPGPMFSFSAFAGGLAASGGSVLMQVLGALVSGLGIFLPGILLIFFTYPVWEQLKAIKGIKVSLKGVNAVAGGLISVAAVTLTTGIGFSIEALVATLLTIVLLLSKKVPAPLIVLAGVILGLIF